MSAQNDMEIERKWIVSGWPQQDLPLVSEQYMEQGYINVRPTVRIRLEQTTGCRPTYILCCKKGSGLSVSEVEFPIEKVNFDRLKKLIGYPLIPKIRRTFQLPGGLCLEVNDVDPDAPTHFWYAEIEFPNETAAHRWDAAAFGLSDFLSHEVTGQPGESMGAYWERTRLSPSQK